MENIKKFNSNIILLALFLCGAFLWGVPSPEGITREGWHLFVIFVITIAGIIANPVPMGAISVFSITACVLTGTLSLENCLGGFSSEIVWLVVFAFFISLGFIKTGLGSRIAYFFIEKLGKTTLGLSYGLVFAEFILSPLIPSVVARGGGIIFPIAQSVCKSYIDKDHKGVSAKNGGFIMQVCLQSNVITSSLFLTAMAANPLIVKLAEGLGVEITWFDWAFAAFLPGIVNLFLMPLVLYYVYPPTIKHSESAPKIAREKLAEMGPMNSKEKMMLLTFVFLIISWIFGSKIGIGATTTALVGFCMLLIFKIINFEDTISDKGAWHTFIWFSTLVMLSGFLAKAGMMGWMGNQLQHLFLGLNPVITVVCLSLFYFFIHYFFASITAHVTVLFPTFFTVFVSVGIPSKVAALSLGFLSILSGGLTHFGISSAPIFFGAGYMKTKTWWYVGFIMSLLNLLVWGLVASVWWKVLGMW